MNNQCPYCRGRIALNQDSGEMVCEACGAVICKLEECFSNATSYQTSLLLTNRKDFEVMRTIEGIQGRIALSNAVVKEAKYIAEGIVNEGVRCSILELAFFSVYTACRPYNPMLCQMVLKEFYLMGLKTNKKNCMKVLNRFWRFYKYRKVNIESYLNSFLENVKYNPYIENYAKMLIGMKANFLWTKVYEFSAILLRQSNLYGFSIKVRVLASLFIACDKMFKSFGLENPVTLDFISYNFHLNKNNLQKVSEKIALTFYENLAKM